MAKAGDEYQEIVGAVAKALDPGASVNIGQWIDGPDGRRDLDVEVRGTVNGSATFVLIECKDWADPVGIAVVDALDSKRRDLNTSRAIIYSNSGFTAPALRKAARVGIEMAAALKAGDQRIKVVIEKALVARRLSIDSIRPAACPFPGEVSGLEDGWQIEKLLFSKLPVVNWLSDLSGSLMQEHGDAKQIRFRCVFRPNSDWTYNEKPVRIAGFDVLFKCSKNWLAQTVRVDVTLGLFDYLRNQVVVPSQQTYAMGFIDRDAWIEVESGPEEKEPAPGSFELYLTLLNPFRAVAGLASPAIDALITERDVTVE